MYFNGFKTYFLYISPITTFSFTYKYVLIILSYFSRANVSEGEGHNFFQTGNSNPNPYGNEVRCI